jgi:hypothetical protein
MPDIPEIYGKAVRRAQEDDTFRSRLLQDPHGAIQEVAGAPIPEGIEVVVHENTTSRLHFVLPPRPQGELSDAQLEQVAGGHGKGAAFGGECTGKYDPDTVDEAVKEAFGWAIMGAFGYSWAWDLG